MIAAIAASSRSWGGVGMSDRVSVPLEAELREQIRSHPERLGLSAEWSEGRRLAELVRAGVQAKREQQREAERTSLYAEWREDREHGEAVRLGARAAVKRGIL